VQCQLPYAEWEEQFTFDCLTLCTPLLFSFRRAYHIGVRVVLQKVRVLARGILLVVLFDDFVRLLVVLLAHLLLMFILVLLACK